jgi:hypothetical protein
MESMQRYGDTSAEPENNKNTLIESPSKEMWALLTSSAQSISMITRH